MLVRYMQGVLAGYSEHLDYCEGQQHRGRHYSRAKGIKSKGIKSKRKESHQPGCAVIYSSSTES